MSEIKFTSRVLGEKAVERLRKKELIQTIRSDKEMVGVGFARIIDVLLDSKKIGTARVSEVPDKIRLCDLDLKDANRGGFSNIPELQEALRRAGYRFKPLCDYKGNRVRFEWR